jgi:hypothetical protein
LSWLVVVAVRLEQETHRAIVRAAVLAALELERDYLLPLERNTQ